jgi:hypothetical protein
VHIRGQIRDAVVAALKAVPELAGITSARRVFSQQTAPAIIVYTNDETAEQITVGQPVTSARELVLNIEILTKAGEGALDTTLDYYSVLIERALAKTAAIPAKTWHYTGLQVTTSGDAEKAAASGMLEYKFVYHIKEGAPSTGV